MWHILEFDLTIRLWDFYLNNRVFLSRNYRLIVTPRKFGVLKIDVCLRSEASRGNMLVFKTSNFRGATIRPIALRHERSVFYIIQHYIFFHVPVKKSNSIISNSLGGKLLNSNIKLGKKTDKNPLNMISIVYFLSAYLVTEKNSRTSSIHSGIFLGRAP